MRVLIFILVVVAFTSFFTSCEEVLPTRVVVTKIDSTYMDANIPDAQSRIVLFEEYTGASCINCPDGHLKLKEISDVYSSKMAIVGLHQGVLAEPAHANGPNFITSEAAALASSYGISSLPSAVINRMKFDGTFSQGRLNWKSRFESIMNQPVKVNLTSKFYKDVISNKDILELKIYVLEDISDNLNYSIALTESKIIAPQKNGSDVIEEYEHEYVLRKMYTNALGDELAKISSDGGIYKKGRVFYKRIEIDNLKAHWKPENLSIVSFVTNAATKESMQATEAKFAN